MNLNKTIFFMLFFSLVFLIFGENLKFEIKINHYKASKIEKEEIERFSEILEERFTEFNWEIPKNILRDDQKIEIYHTITVKKELNESYYQVALNCYGGISSQKRQTMPDKKNIYFREKETNIYFDYDEDPFMETENADDIVNVLKFYSLLILGKSCDRLSFVDSENFQLLGSEMYNKLNDFSNLIKSNIIKENWKERIQITEKYNNVSSESERKLEALFYNARYFYNISEFNRSKLFVPYILENLKLQTKDDRQSFLQANRINLLKIFVLNNDSSSLIGLQKIDKKNLSSIYNTYLKKIKKN